VRWKSDAEASHSQSFAKRTDRIGPRNSIATFCWRAGLIERQSLMRMRGFIWGIALIGFAFSLAADETADTSSALALNQSDIFQRVDSYALIQALPLPIQSNLFPAESLSLGEMQKVSASPRRRSRARDAKDFVDSKDVSARALVPSNPFYYGGEIGVFYGHATGKFGGDAFGGYAIGTVGNDKLQITAGTSYEEWDGHSSHFHSFGPR
jgi:hypothetical protein